MYINIYFLSYQMTCLTTVYWGISPNTTLGFILPMVHKPYGSTYDRIFCNGYILLWSVIVNIYNTETTQNTNFTVVAISAKSLRRVNDWCGCPLLEKSTLFSHPWSL